MNNTTKTQAPSVKEEDTLFMMTEEDGIPCEIYEAIEKCVGMNTPGLTVYTSPKRTINNQSDLTTNKE